MEHLEIEVKFHIKNIDILREALLNIGASENKRTFEKNYRYDNTNNDLIKNKSILRLREYDNNTLTFKSRPTDAKDKNFKIHRELEVEVSNFSTMNLILESLGFRRKQIYEKWRTIFIHEDTVFCIDEMPFGTFLEIEGNKNNIVEMSKRLSLNWDQRILISYLEIFDIIRDQYKLDFCDITFENFKTENVHIDEILPDLIESE